MLVAMETCFKECLFPCLPLPSLHLESFCCHNSRIRLLPSPCRLPHCGMRWGETPQPRSRALGQVKPPWGTALFLPHATINRGVRLWGPGPPCGQEQRRCLYSLQVVSVPLVPVRAGCGRGSPLEEHLWAMLLPASRLVTQQRGSALAPGPQAPR